ncbi:MAG: ATP-binding protein, partial [Gammaproteobacteria bacterium]
MYTEFERKHIQLELAGDGARIYGDRFALETLVKNLLDNACKYTPAGGYVHVDVSGHDAGALLYIEDSGPGVPEDQYQRIFDRFYRLGGDQHESGVIGCGLGLAIVRHIADLHGASIELHQSGFESGLSVSVFFPVSKP